MRRTKGGNHVQETKKPKTFLEKLKAARIKCGSIDKLYATLFGKGVVVSVPTITSWLNGKHKPYGNNVKVVEPELDLILAAK